MGGRFRVLPAVVVFAVGWCGGVGGEADVGLHLGEVRVALNLERWDGMVGRCSKKKSMGWVVDT